MKHLLLIAIIAAFSATTVWADSYVIFAGGVSKSERDMAPKRGTRLAFFEDPRAFLAAVKVRVTNADGLELVNMEVPGPWLIVDLPSGKYTVVAKRQNGEIQSAVINVDENKFQEFGFKFSKSS